MAEKGDLAYYRNLDREAMDYAIHKPWSDPQCGLYLMELGAILGLLPGKGRLLDLGCGTGWTSHLFAKSGYAVTGTDFAAEAVEAAKRHYGSDPTLDLRFVQADYAGLGFADEFDCAVFFDSLHHADDEEKALASACKALKPGGILVTSEPGVGHARRSRATVEQFGVIEKDMPPFRIIKAGRRAGFTGFAVYPHATFHHVFAYRAPKGNLLGRALRVPGVRSLLAILNQVAYRHLSGIVVLRK